METRARYRPRRRLTDVERILRAVPERDYMEQIIETAEWLGYLVYHVNDSRRDKPGFLDIWCVGKPGGPQAGRLVVIETKRETEDPSTEQLMWLSALEQVTTVQAMVARPRDVDRVLELLQGRVE
jgi:RecB family endonuclease NucS